MSSKRSMLVIQSQREPVPEWVRICLDSVAHWAASNGADYRFVGDDMFERLAPDLRAKTRDRWSQWRPTVESL